MKNIYTDKKVAILGYGIEGQDAEKFLKSRGAEVIIFDKKFDKNYLDELSKFDIIVRSPGVYRFLPEIIEAEKNGVVVTSVIKIFFENCLGKIIGVTGTKGKGTTSTLIYEILKADGKEVYLAGNIGKPMLKLLPVISSKSYVILEMSSFQLIDLDISPHIAVVLNITLDHMDWHKDRDEYVDAKKNIISHQTSSDFAVINFDYETPRSFAKITKGKLIEFSKSKLDPKFKKDLLLRGEHNLENIAAAVAVGRVLKIDDKTTLKAVRNFKGLEHRLELVDTIGNVTFYNDSFATGPQSTVAAINSFTEPETLILGGSDKGLNYSELGRVISEKENVNKVILIGTTGGKIGKYIHKNDLQFEICNLKFTSMKEIVGKAFEISKKGSVVILSPASASFDMFKNYKDRGNQFKKAVEYLKNG
jgi:UDP-N-acetylmuramoylalanine--D-glutamate ligase